MIQYTSKTLYDASTHSQGIIARNLRKILTDWREYLEDYFKINLSDIEYD